MMRLSQMELKSDKMKITIMDHCEMQGIRKNTKNSEKQFSALPKLWWSFPSYFKRKHKHFLILVVVTFTECLPQAGHFVKGYARNIA